MSKKKTTYPPVYKRKDCERIWIDDIDTGPVFRWKKGTFSDNAYLTKNDLILSFRVIGRYLSREFMLVPLSEVPADEMPTIDEVPVGMAALIEEDDTECSLCARGLDACTCEDGPLIALEEVEPASRVPDIVSDPFGERMPKMLEAGKPPDEYSKPCVFRPPDSDGAIWCTQHSNFQRKGASIGTPCFSAPGVRLTLAEAEDYLSGRQIEMRLTRLRAENKERENAQ